MTSSHTPILGTSCTEQHRFRRRECSSQDHRVLWHIRDEHHVSFQQIWCYIWAKQNHGRVQEVGESKRLCEIGSKRISPEGRTNIIRKRRKAKCGLQARWHIRTGLFYLWFRVSLKINGYKSPWSFRSRLISAGRMTPLGCYKVLDSRTAWSIVDWYCRCLFHLHMLAWSIVDWYCRCLFHLHMLFLEVCQGLCWG